MTSAFVKRILAPLLVFLCAFYLMVGYGAAKKEACSEDRLLQKYDCSLVKIKAAAKEGNSSAEYALGYIYFYGITVRRNPQLAKLWILRAAAKGHPLALKAKQLLHYGFYSKVPSKPLRQILPRHKKPISPMPISGARSTPMPTMNRVRD